MARVRARKVGTPEIQIMPAIPYSDQPLSMVCFDQTLSNTGLVVLKVHNGALEVTFNKTLKTKTDQRGPMGSIEKAVQLNRMLEDLSVDFFTYAVAEMPIVRGYRVESSLCAAIVISRFFPLVRFIHRSKAASLFVKREIGNPKASSLAVQQHYAPDTKMDEHQRDAFMLGLASLITGEVS